MSYSTQEEHEEFLKLFKRRYFKPEPRFISHFIELKYDNYVKECMTGWLESEETDNHFTKKEFYQALGFQKPNEAFNKFWRFLTAPRDTGHYLIYDDENKKWMYFN